MSRRRGFTLVELLVVIAIISVLVALLVPVLGSARESSRRLYCGNNLRNIAMALRQYHDFNEAFPPAADVSPSYDEAQCPRTGAYDVWNEARDGRSGASWILLVLPYLDQEAALVNWDFTKNVRANQAIAQLDFNFLYCPTRRNRVRPEDRPIMFLNMQSGGTDYGGSMGYVDGFRNELSASGGHDFSSCEKLYGYQQGGRYRGVFLPNSRTQIGHIRDGVSHTLLVGELQRLIPGRNVAGQGGHVTSNDGWAAGGVANLFVTSTAGWDGDSQQPGGINNRFFESAGSEHPGGANFALADGSTHFVSENIDPLTYALLGSIRDGEAVQLPR